MAKTSKGQPGPRTVVRRPAGPAGLAALRAGLAHGNNVTDAAAAAAAVVPALAAPQEVAPQAAAAAVGVSAAPTLQGATRTGLSVPASSKKKATRKKTPTKRASRKSTPTTTNGDPTVDPALQPPTVPPTTFFNNYTLPISQKEVAHTRPSQHFLSCAEDFPNKAFMTQAGYMAKAGQQVGGSSTGGGYHDPSITSLPASTVKSRKTNWYSLLRELNDPVINAELKIVTTKGRPSQEKSDQRKSIIARWEQEYPELYRQSLLTDERVKDKDRSLAHDPTRLTSGNKKFLCDNVKPVHPKLSLAMGCIVTNIPMVIMDGFIQGYGDPIVQQTVLGGSPSSPAQAINISKLDDAFLVQFEKRAPVAGLTEQEAEEKRKLFRQVALMSEELVRLALLEQPRDSQVTGSALKAEEIATKVDNAIDFQENWLGVTKDKWTLELLHDKIVDSLSTSQHPLAFDHEDIYLRLKECGVEGWFIVENRTKYFFHHWFCMINNPGIVPGSSIEPHEVLATGENSPRDCPTLTSSVSAAIGRLEVLARDVLGYVFDGVSPTPTLLATATTPLVATAGGVGFLPLDDISLSTVDVSPSGGGAADSITTESITEEEVGFGGFTPLKEHIHLFPGILKSGNKNVHQNLHVDNAAVLNSDLMKDILKDVAHFPTVKPKDWLDYGYYIDTPLSAEGSWLRIAVPDPDNKRFVMELVFVPFGSCLIRSAALFHSGHYGSPGNTRMHGLLLLKDKLSDTTHLGYINDVLQKPGHPAYGWELNWSGL